jgi:hypothetical protein
MARHEEKRRQMVEQTRFAPKKSDIGGNFEWEKKAHCTCGRFIQAIDDAKFVFVHDSLHGEGQDARSRFYIMPIDARGCFDLDNAIEILHCPWCGDPVNGRKKAS